MFTVRVFTKFGICQGLAFTVRKVFWSVPEKKGTQVIGEIHDRMERANTKFGRRFLHWDKTQCSESLRLQARKFKKFFNNCDFIRRKNMIDRLSKFIFCDQSHFHFPVLAFQGLGINSKAK